MMINIAAMKTPGPDNENLPLSRSRSAAQPTVKNAVRKYARPITSTLTYAAPVHKPALSQSPRVDDLVFDL